MGDPLYVGLKAAHIIFIVTWFAGIFYLPRLFIYHGQARDAVTRAMFQTMEAKLYRIIMRPSMVLTVVLGISLLTYKWTALHASIWIWLKLVAVIALIGYHHVCGGLIRRFALTGGDEAQPKSDRFLRLFNEIPALLLIIIVVLAVTKPF